MPALLYLFTDLLPVFRRQSLYESLINIKASFVYLRDQVDSCALVFISFFIGVSISLLQTSVLDVTLRLTCVFVAGLLFIIGIANVSIRKWCLFLCAFCFALFWANHHYQLHLEHILKPDLQGISLSVEGQVQGLPDTKNGNTRFRFLVTESVHDSLEQRRLQLSCYRCPLTLKPGQKWRFTVRLKRPRGYASWGAFDYEKYLFRHRVAATGYVRLKEPYKKIDSSKSFFDKQRWQIKLAISELANAVPKSERLGYAMIRALSIGDKSGFSSEQRQVFQDTGISHLMAISGLHVGLVFMFASVLVGRLLWPIAGVFELVPRQTIVLFPALLAAFYYSGLAGFSVPTQRAFIMLSVYVLAKLLARSPSLLRVLLIAVVIILLNDPFSVLDMGFWLSCMAVFIIALAQRKPITQEVSDEPIQQNQAAKLSLIRLQPIIWLGMLPLSAALFGQVSLISPFVNLFMVPLFCLVLIPATLFSLILLLSGVEILSVELLSHLASVFNYVYVLLEFVAGLSFAKHLVSSVSTWEFAACILVISLFFLASRWRYFAALALAVNILVGLPAKLSNEMRIALIDVGQGLAMVIESGDYVLVYDTGPRYRTGFTAAAATLIPYLNTRGIQQIDTLIISHADNDHIGGYQTIADQFDVKQVITSRVDKLPNAQACVAGQAWQKGLSTFSIISPDSGTPKGSNNHSCVLRIEHQGVSTLITGDIEKQVERYLISQQHTLAADIMLVPHQGSKTSSTREFIDAVSPKLVLFAAGYRNHYGHPHKSVVERYQKRNVKSLSTIDSGSIILNIKENDWHFNEFRKSEKAFWHDQKIPIKRG